MDERKCVVRGFLGCDAGGEGRQSRTGGGGQARTGDGDQGMNDVVMRIIVIVCIILIDLYIVVINSHYCALIAA